MKSFSGELAEQRNCFRAHHRIETVERLIENQYGRLMGDRLCKPDTLSHSFAVTCNLSIGSFHETHAFQRNLAQIVRAFAIVTMDHQKRIDKLSSRHTSWK